MHDTSDVFQSIRSLIAQVSPTRIADIRQDSRLREDLGLDSVASMELLSLFDTELGLELEMEDVLGITTVGAMVALANSRMAANVQLGAC